MSFQKNIAVLCAFAAFVMMCMAMMPAATAYNTKWLILNECAVKVNGTTNVNSFTCTVAGYSNTDTLTCFISKTNNGTVTMSGRMALPVFSFDCVNNMMTKDLRKTLKEKEYPNFYIHFISMAKYPALQPAQESVTGVVNIELAGVKKQLEINYKVSMDDRGIIQMTGTQSIHFSDFNLVAPRKLGGMIKTNDRLDVEFTLHCRIIK